MTDMTAEDYRRRASAAFAAAERLDAGKQYTDADLKTMSPQRIAEAYAAGQFAEMLNTDLPKDAE